MFFHLKCNFFPIFKNQNFSNFEKIVKFDGETVLVLKKLLSSIYKASLAKLVEGNLAGANRSSCYFIARNVMDRHQISIFKIR